MQEVVRGRGYIQGSYGWGLYAEVYGVLQGTYIL